MKSASPKPGKDSAWFFHRGGATVRPYPAPSDGHEAPPGTLSAKASEQFEAVSSLMPLSPPLRGARVSTVLSHMPGSVRSYRKGYHEGHDFYPYASGGGFGYGSPVLAAGPGRVIRVWDERSGYKEMNTKDRNALLATASWKLKGGLPPADLDVLRGRQVWVDMGGGVVARYCHLSAVAKGLEPGQEVLPGEVLGEVGNSGTSHGAEGNHGDAHLHFELRIGESYVGDGLTQAEARDLFRLLFGETKPAVERGRSQLETSSTRPAKEEEAPVSALKGQNDPILRPSPTLRTEDDLPEGQPDRPDSEPAGKVQEKATPSEDPFGEDLGQDGGRSGEHAGTP